MKYKYREQVDKKLLAEYAKPTNGISKFNIYQDYTGKSKNEDFLMIEMVINGMEKVEELKKLYTDLNDLMSRVKSENKNFNTFYKGERRRFRLFLKKEFRSNPATVKLLDNLSYLISDESEFLEKIKFFINHLDKNYKDKLN